MGQWTDEVWDGALKKKSFILYADYISFISVLTDEQKGKLFQQILEYVNYETDMETDDKTVLVVWLQIKNSLDRDIDKYKKILAEREEKGRLGGIIRALKSNQIVSKENIEFLANCNCYTSEFFKEQNVSDETIDKLNAIKTLK